jgi:hypothetical protein
MIAQPARSTIRRRSRGRGAIPGEIPARSRDFLRLPPYAVRMHVRAFVALTAALLCSGPIASGLQAGIERSHFLYVWAADADGQDDDFLAVVNADPRSPAYGCLIATLPVGARGTRPHHTEYEMPDDGFLWANGFDAGRTFLFDLRDPLHPALQTSFGDPDGFTHPHSYARLPNGHLLATFQQRAGAHDATGGLVEFDREGRVVRSASAAAPAIDAGIRPYSLAVLPGIDRAVTTSADMHLHERSRAIQIWRLSDLSLLQTMLLPAGADRDASWLTAEPRVLADGRTVMVNTFTCGLYRIAGLETANASAESVYATPYQDGGDRRRFCAVPVTVGNFWIQTSGPEHAVITLDISDPRRPRAVSRLTLGPDEIPHWIAIEPSGGRVVITGYEALESRVLVATLDRRSGALRLDPAFRTPGAALPGLDFGRARWLHGASGRAIPHGAVFSRQ